MINNKSALTQYFIKNGRFPFPIIDMHAHRGQHLESFMIADTLDQQVKYMDDLGFTNMVLVGHKGLLEGGTGAAEDLSEAKRFPQGKIRLYHPVVSHLLDDYSEIETVTKNPEYVGFKFLGDYHQSKISDPRHTPVWEFADRHHLAVLAHTWGDSPYDGPDEVEKIVSRYKNLSLVCGHSIFGAWKEGVALAKEHPNMYLELTTVLWERGPVEFFVENGLSEQILFGVDSPWYSYTYNLGALLTSGISDEDVKNILHYNPLKVLSRVRKDLPGF